jgi:hypothetical protein
MSKSLDFQLNSPDATIESSMTNVNSGYEFTSRDAGIVPSSFQPFVPPSNCYIHPESLQLEWPSVLAGRMEEVNGALSPGYSFPTHMRDWIAEDF